MLASGIVAGSIFRYLNPACSQPNVQNFQKEFQQLGQDPSAGNLSQAQADFQALQPASSTTSLQLELASPSPEDAACVHHLEQSAGPKSLPSKKLSEYPLMRRKDLSS